MSSVSSSSTMRITISCSVSLDILFIQVRFMFILFLSALDGSLVIKYLAHSVLIKSSGKLRPSNERMCVEYSLGQTNQSVFLLN